MTWTKQTYTGREGEGDFAFIFEVKDTTYRIACIALSLRCPEGEVENISLSILDDGQYVLPEFKHPSWASFDALVNSAQAGFNFVAIKEDLLVTYQKHFDEVMNTEAAWIAQRTKEYLEAQDEMAQAIETDNTLNFLKVFWAALRRLR